MKVKKIVFSPTGGTEKIAEILAENISQDIININLCDSNLDFNNIVIEKSDMVIIAMPSFGGRCPIPAIERLKQIKGNCADCIVVAVYGNRAYDDTLVELEDTARYLEFNVIAGISAVAKHSIMHQYATNRPDFSDKEQLANFTKMILNRSNYEPTAIPGKRPYKRICQLELFLNLIKIVLNVVFVQKNAQLKQ